MGQALHFVAARIIRCWLLVQILDLHGRDLVDGAGKARNLRSVHLVWLVGTAFKITLADGSKDHVIPVDGALPSILTLQRQGVNVVLL